MIGSLRARLFVAILGTVLIAVGASLALGVLLTRSAVRSTISHDVQRQDEALARQISTLPATAVESLERRGVALAGRLPSNVAPLEGPLAPGRRSSIAPRPAAQVPLKRRVARKPAAPAVPPPGGKPTPQSQIVLSSEAAAKLLPSEAARSLRRSGSAQGTANIDGRQQIYAARAAGSAIALVLKPDVVSGEDFRRYIVALLIASGVAALIAAAVAALFSRRLTSPLRALAEAARELASGGHPEPVPPGGTMEVDELASSFNAMSQQLSLARDAERGLLLSVSHDLRTPLTSIRGYAEGIEDGTVEPREGAAILAEEAGRLERLVGDLLALARLRQKVLEVRREHVDLLAVGNEAAARLRHRAAEKGLTVEVLGEHASASADHDRVLQVVTNLLDNALRVSPEGGTVRIDAREGFISVRDEGPGIPEAEMPRAFERFHLRSQAGERSPDGAGLGLAIVRELSEAMGGSASVENLQGGGACFTVRLPVDRVG